MHDLFRLKNIVSLVSVCSVRLALYFNFSYVQRSNTTPRWIKLLLPSHAMAIWTIKMLTCAHWPAPAIRSKVIFLWLIRASSNLIDIYVCVYVSCKNVPRFNVYNAGISRAFMYATADNHLIISKLPYLDERVDFMDRKKRIIFCFVLLIARNYFFNNNYKHYWAFLFCMNYGIFYFVVATTPYRKTAELN